MDITIMNPPSELFLDIGQIESLWLNATTDLWSLWIREENCSHIEVVATIQESIAKIELAKSYLLIVRSKYEIQEKQA